jgi:hypothetical protein
MDNNKSQAGRQIFLDEELEFFRSELTDIFNDKNRMKTQTGSSGAPKAYRKVEACRKILNKIADNLQNEHDVYTSIACGN